MLLHVLDRRAPAFITGYLALLPRSSVTGGVDVSVSWPNRQFAGHPCNFIDTRKLMIALWKLA